MNHDQYARLTDALLASYAAVGGINNIDKCNLPSKRAIGGICERLLQILFPGFHDRVATHSTEVASVTARRVENLVRRLSTELEKSLNLGGPEARGPEAADALVTGLLENLPGVRRLLHTDLEAAYEGDPAALSYEEIIVAYPSIEAVSIQRVAHLLHLARVPLIPRIMTEWAHSRTGIDIHPGARIGSHFFIDHGTGVVVGETCTIGDHVKLYHGVTLGARSFQKDAQGRIVKGGKRHPDVGDGVIIYPNSTVLGGDTRIGEHTTIGGNVFLQHSVPPFSLVYYEENSLRIVPKALRAP